MTPGARPRLIPWLKELPEHWAVRRAKYLFNQSHIAPKEDDGIVTAFRDGQVTLRENRRTDGFMLAEQEVGYQGVRHGQLVMHSMDAFAGAIGVSDSDGKCTPEYVVLEPRLAGIDPRFYAAVLREMARQRFIEVSCPSVRERAPRIRYSTFGDMLLPLPPLDEQRAIADLLDTRLQAVGALIAKKERLLELSEEERQARVARIVTQGLDSRVPPRDSGVPWLGLVPAHWAVKRLKYAALFQRGHDLPADAREPGNIPIISSGGVIGNHSTAKARGPGVVTGRYGSIGEFTYVAEDYWPLNTALYTRELRGNSARWLYYAVTILAPLFVMESKKSAVPGVDRNDLHPYPLVVPPRSEQDSIAAHLDELTRIFDERAGALRSSLERLREYRGAIITAAVTGQLHLHSREAA